ncbi:LysE family transporter [uncultured Campylobacter sp.]|uniref:LysE family translocator n=1 Tax=uncultured Campylobacter sp. TaxID=218934 RepID=UPI002635D0EB|nr:LysE family transporter [uncultured Campylobacter sp.]
MNAFLQGLLLGFSAAVPLGPVNVMIMSAAIRSFWSAFAIGLGAMSADAAYLLLLAFGALEYLQGETVEKVIGIFGFCYLAYISCVIFKNANRPVTADLQQGAEVKFSKNYAKGFFVTLANPYTVGFWLSVAGFAKSFENAGAVVAGLVAAIFIWIVSMPFAVHKSAKFISQNIAKWLNYAGAVILLGFAFFLLYNLWLL